MNARRTAIGIALLGIAPMALTVLNATPAAAHGSMSDPVSRVAACFAEGPENPKSAACKAAVQLGGTQALYDWNAVRDGDADGRSKERIPDGKLCSAGNDEYKGLDLPRADWPATAMKAGKHTFRYRATAPHKGTFALYLTKDGYDPTKPLKWSDLEAEPFAKATDPTLEDGSYVFDGTVPARSGRHLVYSIWQRSDSPEAFYTCSDVVFGKDGAGNAPAPAPTASAPTDGQIATDAAKSSMDMDHHGHTAPDGQERSAPAAGSDAGGMRPDGAAAPADGSHLAKTGGDGTTAALAIGGAAVLALGSGVLFTTARRRSARHQN
ncbi:lytic polysaccharide monooxygenase [Streptomyces sp. NPDC093707]|uniref:lytic polysaccharide monooxygenase auxiliary activity family 9 protein n=1 Tax=Streptomyces sp. NPDC093707 TaxID=3154984 RepID=UPI003450D39C